jgi:hypothetical protein
MTNQATRQLIDLQPGAINCPTFEDIPQLPSTSVSRDAGLLFKYHPIQDTFELTVLNGTLFPPKRAFYATVPMSWSHLYVVVNECRDEWRRWVVNYREPDGVPAHFVFDRAWDFSRRTQLLDEIGPYLAVAGHRLFTEIFLQGDPHLREIGEIIAAGARRSRLVLTVHSEDFFVPWPMLYTHPGLGDLAVDGSNWQPEGFWGSRHIIEHNTDRYASADVIRLEGGQLSVSLNVDDRLDQRNATPSVKPMIEFFERSPLVRAADVVYTKREASVAMGLRPYPYQICYFCCHGVSTGHERMPATIAKLELSDDPPQPITPSDIKYWFRDRTEGMESEPVVFINACESGQMASLFYHGFAPELLKRKAKCVIGSQIDIPVVFAPEYAKLFFNAFFSGRPIGGIIRDLAWKFLHEHKNPLGLTYSLYRGADAYLNVPVRNLCGSS